MNKSRDKSPKIIVEIRHGCDGAGIGGAGLVGGGLDSLH